MMTGRTNPRIVRERRKLRAELHALIAPDHGDEVVDRLLCDLWATHTDSPVGPDRALQAAATLALLGVPDPTIDRLIELGPGV